jgi:hypothetical protein
VLRSIDLQDQHCLIAQKIRHEFSARHLAAKLQVIQLPIAQARPKPSFCARLALSEPSRNACQPCPDISIGNHEAHHTRMA